jgi:hypothetical protein
MELDWIHIVYGYLEEKMDSTPDLVHRRASHEDLNCHQVPAEGVDLEAIAAPGQSRHHEYELLRHGNVLRWDAQVTEVGYHYAPLAYWGPEKHREGTRRALNEAFYSFTANSRQSQPL